MPLIRLPIIFSLFLVSCINIPPKPIVEICAIDVVNMNCYCRMTTGDEKSAKELMVLKDIKVHPIEYCDKATAFKPDSWEKVQNYIDALRDELDKAAKGNQ